MKYKQFINCKKKKIRPFQDSNYLEWKGAFANNVRKDTRQNEKRKKQKL
jgi:hypothetical protein